MFCRLESLKRKLLLYYGEEMGGMAIGSSRLSKKKGSSGSCVYLCTEFWYAPQRSSSSHEIILENIRIRTDFVWHFDDLNIVIIPKQRWKMVRSIWIANSLKSPSRYFFSCDYGNGQVFLPFRVFYACPSCFCFSKGNKSLAWGLGYRGGKTKPLVLFFIPFFFLSFFFPNSKCIMDCLVFFFGVWLESACGL